MKHSWFVNFVSPTSTFRSDELKVGKKSFKESQELVKSYVNQQFKKDASISVAYCDYTTFIPIIKKFLFARGDSLYINRAGLVF